VTIRRPVVRVRYELQEIGRPDLADAIAPMLEQWRTGRRAVHTAG